MKLKNTSIKSFFAISDVVSLLNMIGGFLSIVFSINNQLEISSLLIIIALVFDSVDGGVARKLNRNDQFGFGKNIDSLSDIISFGVAPAILLYSIGKTIPNSPIILITTISLLIVICGVLRLTRYNIISDLINYKGFIGFPIPGIGLILSTFYLSGLFNIYVALLLMIITSLLMISNIKYPKFDNKPVLVIGIILIILMILPIKISIYNIRIPELILLLLTLHYLFINLIFKNN